MTSTGDISAWDIDLPTYFRDASTDLANLDSAGGSQLVAHSATCNGRYCPGCGSSYNSTNYSYRKPPAKRPKYDPHQARRMWQPEALAVTSKPRKRPLRQVRFNQVCTLRPRYLRRK